MSPICGDGTDSVGSAKHRIAGRGPGSHLL